MPTNRLPMLILVMSLLYIFIVPPEPFIFKLFFKLIPMTMIILYAVRQSPKKKSLTHWLIIIGLFFSIIGDGTLHWFVVGLTAFLIGHLFYTVGFLTQWKFSMIRFGMILPIGVYGFYIGRELLASLNSTGNEGLMIPVLLYIITISLMAWSAIMTGNKWATLGSLLFVVSDSILAWNMFVAPVNFSGELIMITYYSAQFLIAHSLWSIVKGSNRIVW
ncbi:lysoplasmalogenase [Virgibacillus sp. C22-A2]|uniref:Lysoplasmalogenase n=1 Tax=Virgibacillus tibetensis TaxID=3042313 RepID=A0ABU6KFG4_9BACI|nr:lysoplasmalogenase [Virgibacillus sp. C22-A2]